MRRLVKHFARLLSRLPTGATLGWFGLELEEITLVLLCFVALPNQLRIAHYKNQVNHCFNGLGSLGYTFAPCIALCDRSRRLRNRRPAHRICTHTGTPAIAGTRVFGYMLVPTSRENVMRNRAADYRGRRSFWSMDIGLFSASDHDTRAVPEPRGPRPAPSF